MEMAYPDELRRHRKWQALAKDFKIPIEEDAELAQARIQRGLKVAMAEFYDG